jgi:PhnB protein
MEMWIIRQLYDKFLSQYPLKECRNTTLSETFIAPKFALKSTIMFSIHPYLNFNGQAEEAMKFYRSIFGGQFGALERFRQSPGYEKMPESEWDKIMHARLPMGKYNHLMATDVLETMGQKLTVGNNFYICIQTESEEETEQLFEALSEGGEIDMPVSKTFWGAYCGMCRDKFGIQWMLNYEIQQTPSK